MKKRRNCIMGTFLAMLAGCSHMNEIQETNNKEIDCNKGGGFVRCFSPNGVLIVELVTVNGGEYKMGSRFGEYGSKFVEWPLHLVRVSSFRIATTETTQLAWKTVMGTNPSRFEKCDSCPVDSITWNEAQQFAQIISRKASVKFRLPTEAEWEFAARAGTTTNFHWGNAIVRNKANCDGCYGNLRGKGTTSVAIFPPNELGIYDMHGNVEEWVEDCWHDGYWRSPNNGSAWRDGADCSYRVVRGGSWWDYPSYIRSASRDKEHIEKKANTIGFRLAQDDR